MTHRFPEDGAAVFVSMELGGSSQLGMGADPQAPVGEVPQRFTLWVHADSCDATVERLRGAGVVVLEEPADQRGASGWRGSPTRTATSC